MRGTRRVRPGCWALFLWASACGPVSCSPEDAALDAARHDAAAPGEAKSGVALSLVAEGFSMITDVEFVKGPGRRVVVLDKGGLAHWVDLEGATPNAPAQASHVLFEVEVDTESELGLLAVAFHPEYEQNGRLFVHYNPKGRRATRLAEFSLPFAAFDRGQAQETRVLIELAQPYTNHNGGELVFGPDGMLYFGLGDGGSGGDPQNRAQNLGTLLGKILRLDVNGPTLFPEDNPFVARAGARPEIFAYGLRNPWKISFTPDDELIVADVGQDRFEEIDWVQAGDNLGWRRREAAHCYEPKMGCIIDGLVEPIFEYGRALGGSVTGGYVYTGSVLPKLSGKYVFGDFLSGRFWALTLPSQRGKQGQAEELAVFDVKSAALGRDFDGELYISDFGAGKLYQLVPGE